MACHVPEGLEGFQRPLLRYISICDKVDHKLKTQPRVLAVMTICVLVCTVKEAVKRYIPYDVIEKVMMSMDDKGVVQVLLKLKPPEHDVLLRLRGSGHEDMHHLAGLLRRYSARPSIAEILLTTRNIERSANLVKASTYRTPKQVLTTKAYSPAPRKICPLMQTVPGRVKIRVPFADGCGGESASS
eukprot:TRINITY_DN1590_c0_g1_i1.p1 TRINITY_DN1590_c0_g1~~TRINITY_DN1590_c0_g1_i1.p1  ORF type:complete len:200 (+),score=23.08 TRINITY_DN1590_c0_g1_i1:43-600(+)